MSRYSNKDDSSLAILINVRRGWYTHRRGDLWLLIAPHEVIYDSKAYDFLWRAGKKWDTEKKAWLADMPMVCNELGEAFELLDNPLFHDVVLTRRAQGSWMCRINEVMIHHENPARAICEAWLTWQDETEKQAKTS